MAISERVVTKGPLASPDARRQSPSQSTDTSPAEISAIWDTAFASKVYIQGEFPEEVFGGLEKPVKAPEPKLDQLPFQDAFFVEVVEKPLDPRTQQEVETVSQDLAYAAEAIFDAHRTPEFHAGVVKRTTERLGYRMASKRNREELSERIGEMVTVFEEHAEQQVPRANWDITRWPDDLRKRFMPEENPNEKPPPKKRKRRTHS